MQTTRATIVSLIALNLLAFAVGAASQSPTRLRISGTPVGRAAVGEFYSFVPTVSTPAECVPGFAVANKPAWAQLNIDTGALSGIPLAVGAATDIVLSVSCDGNFAALPAFRIVVESTPAYPARLSNAYLSWTRPDQNTDGSPLTNLAGYRLRYGTSSAAMENLLFIGSPDTTEAEISGLAPGSWSFEIRAISASAESEFSTVATTIIR